MDEHPSAPATWLVVALATVAMLAALGGAAMSFRIAVVEHGHAEFDDLASLTVVLAYTVMGAVVVFARPWHRIGWLLLVGAACWGFGNGAVDLARHGIEVAPGSVSDPTVWALGGAVVRDIGWYAVALGVPIFFPDGRIASPRWRWLPRFLVVVIIGSIVDTLTAPDADLRLTGWHNPWGLTGALSVVNALAFLASIPFAVVVAGGAVAQLVSRWRRGATLERRQITLFACCAGLPVLAGPLSFLPGAPGWLFSIAALPLPFAVAYAVLAHGLYDLPTAANRGLVWLTLSGCVALLYATIVLGLGALFDEGSSGWEAAVAVGVVAVCFMPLRDVLQRAVNRLTYGRWVEPYAVLSALGQRLEATADAESLLSDVVAELTSLGLDHVTIEDAHGHVVAGWDDSGPRPPVGDVALPVLAYGGRVGTLRFRPARGSLRSQERRLVEDLTGHLGGVLHDRALRMDLQRALERVVRAREEERRRLRRDLHDGLGPALAGHLLQLDVLTRQVASPPEAREQLAALQDDIRGTVLDVRRVVEGLRPPALDELGLAGALTQATRRLTEGSPVTLDLRVGDLPAMSAATEVALFRIVTEAVTNVVRHAEACRCTVLIDVHDVRVRAVVADDGRGIQAGHCEGNGLYTMRERAEEMLGTFSIGGPDDGSQGTTLVAELPLTVRTDGQRAPAVRVRRHR